MYQYGNSCYQTPSAANQIAASAQSGTVVVIGGQSYVLAYSSVTDSTITYLYSPAAGGPTISQTITVIPPPCALLTAADAVDIGWLIAAAWIGVYAIKYLANHLQSEVDGIKNDA